MGLTALVGRGSPRHVPSFWERGGGSGTGRSPPGRLYTVEQALVAATKLQVRCIVFVGPGQRVVAVAIAPSGLLPTETGVQAVIKGVNTAIKCTGVGEREGGLFPPPSPSFRDMLVTIKTPARTAPPPGFHSIS